MGFFDRMNRKQKRDFEKLPADEKARIFATELQNTVSTQMKDEVFQSFYRGHLASRKWLYDAYVQPIEEIDDPQKILELIMGLINEIARDADIATQEHEKVKES